MLGPRGAPLKSAVARIYREAGARVGWNVLVRDLNLDEPVLDARRIEVVANGLPLWHGVQLAVDSTLVSPVRRDGAARRHAAVQPGVALEAAARRKRDRTYRVVVRAQRCRLVVFSLEVGGRWSEEALVLVRKLARARARDAPRQLRASVFHACLHRWSALAAVAAQRAFAASLQELPLARELNVDGEPPCFSDLLADARFLSSPADSRMPLLG